MRLLLATHNPAKIRSYKGKLSDLGIDIGTLDDLGIDDKFEENKSTFEENAKDKALFYYRLTKIPTVAEDSGFEIDYLNGEPGVKSRRWLGHEATDKEILEHIKKIIPTIPKDKRTARFVAVTCLIKSADEIYIIRNTKEGFVTDDIRENFPEGFPYRSCFISGVFNKHVQDLTKEESLQISHRLKNLKELKKYLITN